VTEEFLEHTLWGGEQEGAFETTHDGILFLADVDKMSANLQKKLLKVLEDKKFVSLLDKKGRSLDVRLIVSTTWKMDDLVKEGKMNKNLVKYFTEVVIDIPPLRERKADIPLLTDHFLSKIAIENKVDNYSITPKALKMLMQHAWPKNIIELEQVLRSVCVLAKDGNITDEHISVYI